MADWTVYTVRSSARLAGWVGVYRGEFEITQFMGSDSAASYMVNFAEAQAAQLSRMGADVRLDGDMMTRCIVTYTLPEHGRGLLGVWYEWEYFTYTDGGDVYRALVTNALDTDGFRMGARWESTWAGWVRLLDRLDGWQPVGAGVASA